MTLLLLAGCIENKLSAGPSDAPGIDDDSESHSDETDSGESEDSATDEPEADVCADEAPADDTEAIVAACDDTFVPFTGELLEVWRAAPVASATGIRASRLVDGNRDGVIDAGDPMQIVVDAGWESVQVLDSDGTVLGEMAAGSYRVMSTTGDVDPADLGAEGIVSGYHQGGRIDYLGVVGESTTRWSNTVISHASTHPWLTDLEGDGDYEVLAGKFVLDLATGSVEATLGGSFRNDLSPLLSADLDRDGTEEIFAAHWTSGNVRIYQANGRRHATCAIGGGPTYNASYAVGNLDADDDGELVAAGDGYVAICDADGTLLDSTSGFDGDEPSLVGIGELDGDGEAEIVVAGAMELTAFDSDLSVLWTYSLDERWRWYPFSLADLDGDGRHEVLVHIDGALVVLDSAGATLATYVFDPPGGAAWRSQPIVADVDADGLAEIVVGGVDVVVLESPEGGWPIADAVYDWPGSDRHPGDRTLSGGLPGPDPFWLTPGQNVWQGLTPGIAPLPELGVAFTGLCVESCDGDAVVTVRVSNSSARVVTRGVEVTLEAIATGEVLGTTTVSAPLPAGAGRYVTFRVSADRVGEGLRATVDGQDRVAECDVTVNVAEYADTPCP